MRQTLCAAAFCALFPLLAAHAQQIKEQPPNSPAWAFPFITEMNIPEGPEPQTVPGSSRSFTFAQIYDLLNPPDWFPDRHPPSPEIILKGHGRAQACASCHLINGLGRPEMGGLARLPVAYILQQLADFKSGARIDSGGRMNNIAADLSTEEATQAAEWYASLERRAFTRVVEAGSVPESFVGPRGGTRFAKPGGGMEPIGTRIITLPEDAERVRRRDPCARVRRVRPRRQSRGGPDARRNRRRRQDDGVQHVSWARSAGSRQRAGTGRTASDLHCPPALPVQGWQAEWPRGGDHEARGGTPDRRRYRRDLRLHRFADALGRNAWRIDA
jgi:hypothetical protein